MGRNGPLREACLLGPALVILSRPCVVDWSPHFVIYSISVAIRRWREGEGPQRSGLSHEARPFKSTGIYTPSIRTRGAAVGYSPLLLSVVLFSAGGGAQLLSVSPAKQAALAISLPNFLCSLSFFLRWMEVGWEEMHRLPKVIVKSIGGV